MRTRTIVETRKVPHTIDGKTVFVDEPYTVRVPIPPRDWDHAVRTGLLGLAGVVGAASVAWSTVSIGALLKTDVPAAAAYAAAGTFDLLWIGCMALEWLARYDPARAAAPRRFGWFALVIAMVAITTHGSLAGSLTIGLIGSAVSLGAKVFWWLTLRGFTHRLTSRTQQWVDAQRAEAEGQLALIPVRRDLARARSLVAAEKAALQTTPDADPESPDDEPEIPEGAPELPGSGPMTIKDAVQTARSSGFTDPDAVLRYVRKVADANAKEETVSRYLRSA
ncbi:protein transporter Sec31 [Streptomyces sp. SBC-4]|nr:protein transporter Sec31 [Streptomyces sp. SBC-4]MDV5145913.1 protein transporter Sec31 [Streptomyces sp. SBC-4]